MVSNERMLLVVALCYITHFPQNSLIGDGWGCVRYRNPNSVDQLD